MKNLTLRIIALACALLMLVGTLGLVSCNTTGNGTGTTGGDNTTEEPGNEETPVDRSWLAGDINEKIAALGNFYGRNMSVAWGGNTVDYPIGSLEAINSAIELGADAIGIQIQKTKDGTLVVIAGESLADVTDINDKKGTEFNGEKLPSLYATNKWTDEQLAQLKLKNKDGSVSEATVPTFEAVLKACAGKCFIYVENDNAFDNYADDIYNLVKANNAYSSFLVTPGIEALVEWSKAHNDDAALANFINDKCKAFHHIGLYFEIRAPFDHTANDKNSGWTKTTDDEAGWTLAAKSRHTFLITDNIVAYTTWVAKNQKSALEYQPTNWDALEYSIDKEDLTARYLLISDMHYAPIEFSGYINRVTYRGHSTEDRIANMIANIKAEHAQRGLDAIFLLGDLSTDDFPIRSNVGGNFLKEFWTDYMKPLSEELNVPILAVAGNHDSYPYASWEFIFDGMSREFVWENPKNGDVFIMCDTFSTRNGNTATGGGGSSFTNINVGWVEEQLEKYKDRKNVFLASHYFGRGTSMNPLAELVAKYDNVRAAFDAHSHSYVNDTKELNVYNEDATVALTKTGRLIINTGNYSYGATQYVYINNVQYYNFNYHDLVNSWGYNIVEVSNDSAVHYRIDVDQFYSGQEYSTPGKNGGVFTDVKEYVPYEKYDEIVFYSENAEN